MKKTIFLLLLTAILSCKKGDTGAPGSPGKDGNANVQTTMFEGYTFTWDGTTSNMTLNVPTITSAVFTSGSVSVYIRHVYYSGTWVMLPNNESKMDVIYSTGSVHLTSLDDLSLNIYDVKVVVIPSN